jgi:predicted  nucleic acid-binding Zn-ribbon protein
LKEQILLLRELQEAELKIRGLHEDQGRYPREIETLNEKLAAEKEEALRERERLQFLEKERRRKEGELDQQAEKIKRTKGRLFEVKTNKEYQALLHEIELMEKSSDQNEDEILAILEEIDQLRTSVSDREGSLATMEKDIGAEISEIEGRLSQIVEEIDTMEKRRGAIVKTLNPELIRTYDTLKQRRGIALAVVKRGVCQGCYVNIPPQMFNEVQRNDTVIRCPNCSRILYWSNDNS